LTCGQCHREPCHRTRHICVKCVSASTILCTGLPWVSGQTVGLASRIPPSQLGHAYIVRADARAHPDSPTSDPKESHGRGAATQRR
jgi:hypothetical protein